MNDDIQHFLCQKKRTDNSDVYGGSLYMYIKKKPIQRIFIKNVATM